MISKKHKFNDSQTYVIHIGKCGGGTIKSELQKHNIKFRNLHVTGIQKINDGEIKLNKNDQYIIIIRNPISRIVSAFNYRKWRLKTVYKGQKDVFEKYESINSLAESLYDSNGELVVNLNKDDLHHLKEDINYYLEYMLNHINEEYNVKVITTETLDYDLKRFFNITSIGHKRNSKKMKIDTNKDKLYLSEVAYKNLKKYLSKDYACIEKLFRFNFLTDEQYNILTK